MQANPSEGELSELEKKLGSMKKYLDKKKLKYGKRCASTSADQDIL